MPSLQKNGLFSVDVVVIYQEWFCPLLAGKKHPFKGYVCTLYTVEGEKPAIVFLAFESFWKRLKNTHLHKKAQLKAEAILNC